MADAGNRQVFVEEILSNTNEIGIFPNIFGCPPTGEENAGVIGFDNILEGDFEWDEFTSEFNDTVEWESLWDQFDASSRLAVTSFLATSIALTAFSV